MWPVAIHHPVLQRGEWRDPQCIHVPQRGHMKRDTIVLGGGKGLHPRLNEDGAMGQCLALIWHPFKRRKKRMPSEKGKFLTTATMPPREEK